ncbi:MAG: hypothetical protein QOD06_1739 [Candidatus Binatota bacterium]|nr:hypothetical protein [Candidatus Binatota bacterium]
MIFAAVGRNRRGAVANQARLLGAGAGRLAAHFAAYRVFARFARCFTETLEFFGPRARPFRIDDPHHATIGDALRRGHGVILVTAHLGNWDVSARALQSAGQPVNLVMARETNETAQEFAVGSRHDQGLHVISSDSSVFSAFNMIRALRRNEILAMQLDRGAWSPTAPGAIRPLPFLGGTARFQEGPFHLARLSGAPVIPVFTLRKGLRHYEIRVGPPRTVARDVPRDVDAALRECVAFLERTVREHPDQWFEFAPFCIEDAPPSGETLP